MSYTTEKNSVTDTDTNDRDNTGKKHLDREEQRNLHWICMHDITLDTQVGEDLE